MDPIPPRRDRRFPVRFLAFTGWDALNPQLTGVPFQTDSAMVGTAFLKLFGFPQYFGYRVFSLGVLVLSLAICGVFLWNPDVYGGRGRDETFFGGRGRDETLFFLSFLPYLYLALGPFLFLFTLLFCHGGLWRFLSVSITDDIHDGSKARGLTHSFRNDAWTLKYGALCFSSLFVMLKIILTILLWSSILDVIPLLYWSYLVVLYVSSVGVTMLGLRNLSIMVYDISTKLGKKRLLEREALLRSVDAYNGALKRFSKRISPFVLSQIIIVVFTVSTSIVVVILYCSSGFEKLASRSGDFVCLSILQVVAFWRLMNNVKSLNTEAKNLEQYARQR